MTKLSTPTQILVKHKRDRDRDLAALIATLVLIAGCLVALGMNGGWA